MANIPDLLADMLILVIFSSIGLGIFYGVDTTLWGSMVKIIWNYVPLVFIACGIIVLILKLKLMH
ncbi:MAG: hypothetical protein ABSB10_09965 [Candidatus Bathyarchaeia archaeon]|jgi:hypothetical protein